MANVNSNKMHLEEFQRIMQTIDEAEARSAARILVRRYPFIVLDQLARYVDVMRRKIDGLNSIMGASDEE